MKPNINIFWILSKENAAEAGEENATNEGTDSDSDQEIKVFMRKNKIILFESDESDGDDKGTT